MGEPLRFGVFISDTDLVQTDVGRLRELAAWAEASGFDSAWVPHLPWSLDALVALTVAGEVTTTIELGSAVTPTFPVHPLAMARSALSVHAAIGGRLALGVGPSHQPVIEGMYGLSYAAPARHTREYVDVLGRAFRSDGTVTFEGACFSFSSMFTVPGAGTRPPALLVAALGPRMLATAGELADGTLAWFADERNLETNVVPRITEAAAEAGRPAPRIIAGMPIAVCDEDEGREAAARTLAMYEQIPTYARMLARGAGAHLADIVLVGDEDTIAARLARWAELGVTEYVGQPFPVGDDREASMGRTRAFLADLAGDR